MMPKLISLFYVLILVIDLEFIHLGVFKVCSLQDYSRADFPADFVFGSGTSAYQVEGAPLEDGKTPSTWDTFTHGGYVHGQTGDIACDGYHKYKEDVQLMADTGLEAYRFSVSWPRLIPNGKGPVNQKGLQFYNNLINELIKHGIEPHITLYHGDLPQSLEDEYGGWLSKNIVQDFAAYAEVCFREFGDRVRHWTTFNELNMLPMLGYDAGIMPPRRCSFYYGINCTIGNSLDEPYKVAHNSLLAHASAVRLYQRKYKDTQEGLIGLNVLAFWFIPYSNSIQDILATHRAQEFYVGWFVNPLVNGDYPDVVKKNAGTKIPVFTKTESIWLKGTLDFLAINHYATTRVKDQSSSLEKDSRDVMADMGVDISVDGSSMELYQGLQELLEYLKEIYNNIPIYIHENGLRMRRNGTMNELYDTPRVRYMQGFIGSLLDAIRNGANARGYFTWSFLDVFELMDGYNAAYGLHYVDLKDKDLKRYPKSSALWYSNFLKGGRSTNGLEDNNNLIQLEANNNMPEFSHSYLYH